MRARLHCLAALAFCALSLGGAWYGYHLLGQARIDIVDLAQRRRTLEGVIRQDQRRLAGEARARQARLPGGAAGAGDGAAAAGAKAAPFREPTVDELLAADPKLFDLYLKSFRAQLRSEYGAVYQKLGASPEKIEKFEALATAHEADIRDLRAAADSQGLSQDDPGIAAMRQQINQRFKADLIADLGVSAKLVNQEQKEMQTVYRPMQDMAENLGEASASAQAPMTQAQSNQLMQLMAGSTPEFQEGKAAKAKSIDWNAVLAQAPSFLSPEQVEAIRQQAAATAIQKAAAEYVAQKRPPAP